MADQDDPGESIDPFAGMPLFGDLSRALSGQGPLNWDAARQFAVLAANGGGLLSGTGVSTSANVDPTVRIKYRELAEIARLQQEQRRLSAELKKLRAVPVEPKGWRHPAR